MPFSSLPMSPDKVDVRCDSCGEEYSNKLKEVTRDEVPVPEVFVPHRLFQIGLVLYDSDCPKT